jgi:transposase
MYKYQERQQMNLLPPSIEDYVNIDHPVRAYDAFVNALDLKELGIQINDDKVGNPSYHPKVMLKLLVYGYSYGVRSSRKLEREAVNNLSFIWLLAGLAPDHKTIAEFRRNNKNSLKKVLKQCALICIELDLIDGNTLFVDGTKINANAGIKNNWTKERCLKSIEHIEKRIESILDECEQADTAEQDQSSYVHMNKDLAQAQTFKTKVKDILQTLEQENKRQINTVDEDCRAMSSTKGTHPAYNNQIVVDAKHGLIVSAETTNAVNDVNQFARQIEQANEILEKPCSVACADAGYLDTDDMEKVSKQNIEVIVAARAERSTKKDLIYDDRNDCFICQRNKRLLPRGLTADQKGMVYGIEHVRDCQSCRLCTKSKTGRTTSRLLKEKVRQEFIALYRSPRGKEIYSLRRQKAELPFGHIKRNLKFDSFLLRGLAGTHAEFSLTACCFNIARMITIFGVPMLTAKLAA